MNFQVQANTTSKTNGIREHTILNSLTFRQMHYKTTLGHQTILDLGVCSWVVNRL